MTHYRTQSVSVTLAPCRLNFRPEKRPSIYKKRVNTIATKSLENVNVKLLKSKMTAMKIEISEKFRKL